MKKLTDICDIQYGYAFDSKCFTEDSLYPQLVRIRDVKRGYSETYYSGDYPEEYLITSGDLLIGMDGEFNIARWKSDRALLNQRVCKLTAKKGTNEEYLRFVMSKVLKEIEQKTAFVTVKHLSAKELNKLYLNVPELSEQNKIAEMLSRLEKIIDMRRREIEKLDDLIKSRFIEMFGDINVNDRGWTIQPLGELCTIVRGASPRPIEKFLGGDVPWIKIGDATDGESIYLHSTKEHIVREGVSKSRMVKAGSLIFANCGVSLGFARIITFDGCIHDGWLAMEDIDARLDKVFLLQALNQMTEHFRKIAPAGTQPNLNTAIMKAYKQIIPPMKLQKDFIAFAAQVDKSKLTIQKSLDELETLNKALMQKYFGGNGV